jgi:hypothetical protein
MTFEPRRFGQGPSNQPLISIKKIWRPAKESRSEQPDHAYGECTDSSLIQKKIDTKIVRTTPD